MRALKTIAWSLTFLIPAVAAREGLEHVLPGVAPFITLFPAVVAAGIFGGTAAGVLTAIAGVAAADFLWVGPRFDFAFENRAEELNVALFLVASACVLWATRSARLNRAALTEKEAQFGTLAETIPGLLFATDAAGLNIYNNQSLQDFVGDGIYDWRALIHPTDRERVWSAWQQCLQTGTPYDIEHRLRRRDGQYRWILVRALPVFDRSGRIQQWLGVGLDIEERKHAEAALLQQAERLDIALEAGSLGRWEIDLATKTVHWDARLAAMLDFGEQPVEMDRRAQVRFVDEADRARVASEFAQAVRANGRFASEFRGRTTGGDTGWFVSQAVVLRSERRVVGVLRDVTERRRREDALREALTAREMIVREADHRIKNSLQMVISLLTIQQQRMSKTGGTEAITSAIARVEAIAEAHFALQQSKDLRLVDFGKMLRELCAKLAQLRTATVIHCSLDGDLTMSADLAIPFALMASEILTNALRHAYPADSPGDIAVRAIKTGDGLTVSIVDQGQGMPAPDTVNSGLGSQLINAFAKQAGATVEIVSVPGSGTEVSIKIACTQQEDSKLRRRA